jgi:hypothetical protein
VSAAFVGLFLYPLVGAVIGILLYMMLLALVEALGGALGR